MAIKTRLGAIRYNNRMAKIYDDSKQLERERLARGEMPNPNLTSPEDARKYGWEIVGREVHRGTTITDLEKIVDNALGEKAI